MRLSIPIDDLPRHFAGRETLPAREHGRVIVDSVIIEGPEILAAGGTATGGAGCACGLPAKRMA